MPCPKNLKNTGVYLTTFSMGFFALLKAAQPSKEFKEELEERNKRRKGLQFEIERAKAGVPPDPSTSYIGTTLRK